MNSARRSNDQEHELIKTATKSAFNPDGINLTRKGICYKRGDDYYQDCKAESLIVRALRRYIRLWDEADALDYRQTREDVWSQVDAAWLDAGKAQATDTADKLLLHCIKNMLFNPVSKFKVTCDPAIQNLKREFKFDNVKSNQLDVAIYSCRNFYIGVAFSLVKGYSASNGWAWGKEAEARPGRTSEQRELCAVDLKAFRRYDEISRADVDEFTKSLDFPKGICGKGAG